MQRLRVALVQSAPKLGDVEANLEEHLLLAAVARKQGAAVAVFPELSLTGYLLEDQVPEVALASGGRALGKLLRASRNIDLVVGFVEEAPGHLFHNAAAYLSGGKLVHLHRKVYLPTYGMFHEGRDFAPGDRVRAFDSPHGRFGILICEDAWHPMCAWLLTQQGAEGIFVLSSGPTRGARPGRGISSVGVWHDLLRVTAQFQTGFLIYANRVGYEDGLSFGGGSAAIDPFGRIVASLPALETGMAVADLDPDVLRRARTAYPLLRDENLELAAREIARLRALRYELPEEPGTPASSEPDPRRSAPKRRRS